MGPSLLSRSPMFKFCSLLYILYRGTGSVDWGDTLCSTEARRGKNSNTLDVFTLYCRCKFTGQKVQRLYSSSKEQGSTRWYRIIVIRIILFFIFTITTICHTCSHHCHHHHLYHYCHPQVVFTAKLTVSDKSVKWSFQDQVTPNSLPFSNLRTQASIKALQPQNMVSFGPCVINSYTLLHMSTVTSGSSPTFLETYQNTQNFF